MAIKLPNNVVSPEIRLPPGISLKPPVRMKDIVQYIDHDPAEAEALVALIRRLRREGSEPGAE